MFDSVKLKPMGPGTKKPYIGLFGGMILICGSVAL